MRRRAFLQLGFSAVAGAPTLAIGFERGAALLRARDAAPELESASIPQLQAAMAAGRITAVSLATKFLKRIEKIDSSGPRLRAVIELNPDAVLIARRRDAERKAGSLRGPLHGIPVLLKDNIDTHDKMVCSAGSLALRDWRPPEDAHVVQRLRESGAVILGKTNLSEWANFRGSRSTSGWSARGGLTLNPHVLDRNPSGSSSGSAVAVAANLCTVSVGTETNGSILSPSSYNGVVGLKPTVGLISRSGIIPIAASQDTAGPMARTVTDAAILLSCMVGRDDRDHGAGIPRPESQDLSHVANLDPHALRGARIGVVRKYFRTHPVPLKQVHEQCLDALRSAGAVLVDPIELPEIKGNSYLVMLYEFKAGLNQYLARQASAAEVRSLEQLIDFNERNKNAELPWFGQEILIEAQEKGALTDPPYLEALRDCRDSSRKNGLDAVMEKYRLDAILAPTTGPAHVTDLVHGDRDTGGSSTPAAVAGYPSVTVPAGMVSGLPVGLSFFGRPWSEAHLLNLAFSFEQISQCRPSPKFLRSVSELA